jgi:hypothetical protein
MTYQLKTENRIFFNISTSAITPQIWSWIVGWVEEWWIGKDLEGNGCGLIEILSQHMPGETEENQENP